MTKDYSYLEGKTFKYTHGKNTITAKVIAADYHIGITCVNTENSNEYVICFLGPKAPNCFPINPKIYQYSWASLIHHIEKGHVDASKLLQTINKHTQKHTAGRVTGHTTVPTNVCAFN